MKNCMPYALLSAICLSAAMPVYAAGGAAASVAAAKKIIALNDKEDDTPSDRVEMLRIANSMTGDCCGADGLKSYSDDELDTLYKALGTATFYEHGNTALLSAQARALEEKIRRGKLAPRDFNEMQRSYLDSRFIDEAAAMYRRFPKADLQEIPPITISADAVAATQWRGYAVLDGGKNLRLEPLGLDAGPHIVMVVMTGCHFGQEAIKNIMADPVYGPVMSRYGLLITGNFDPEGVAGWQKKFGFPHMYITKDEKDFPGIDMRFSPNFYFIRDGKVLFDFTGWEDGGYGGSGWEYLGDGIAALHLANPAGAR